jgi:tetratricopeptide (TPR) repeat protein
MSWKPLLAALLLPLCLGLGSRALAQRTPEIVIVVRETGLDSGAPPPQPVRLGQMLTVYQRAGGRLYAVINAPENPRGRNWGWIDASCALPLKQAGPHFSKLLEKDPKNAAAYLGRAAAELALDQPDKVIADCDQVLKLEAHSAPAFQLRARAWIAKEQTEKAIADLSEVLKLQPERTDAYRMRGDAWRKQKDYAKAGGDYSRLLRLSPNDCEAYNYRGMCRFEKGQYEKAIADFNEALCRQPESIQAFEGRGFTWQRLHAYDKADDDFTESIRVMDAQAWSCCRTTWSFVFQGNLRGAATWFASFQETYHRRADAYACRADCSFIRGDFDKALADYNTALWINPNSVRGHAARGGYWEWLKRYDLAMTDFDAALKLDPKFAVSYHAHRGNCRARQGQNDQALADFDAALRLEPDNAHACNAVAWFRATCQEAKYRDGKLALTLATRACQKTDWQGYGIIDTLAAAHAEAGDFDEAVRWQKKALEMADPKSKKEMTERLALYQSHQPYRQPVETAATAK